LAALAQHPQVHGAENHATELPVLREAAEPRAASRV
jgi:hypothetical protein